MRKLLTITLLFFIWAAPQASQAAPFDQAFNAENAQAISADTRVMVVAVDAAAKPAAKALTDALRGVAGVQLVMDSAALGDVAAKSDDEVFAATKAYPVDGVVIVRVFPAAKGQSVAVLAYRNKDGATLRSASVMSDATLDSAAVMTVAATPQKVVEAPVKADPQEVTDRAKVIAQSTDFKSAAVAVAQSDALKRGKYQRLYVHFGPSEWEIYQGAFNTPLTGDQFYKAIREPELYDAYQSNSALRTGLLLGGGVVGALGVGLLFVGIPGDSNSNLVTAGAISLGVGAIGVAWGLFTDTHPISDADARSKSESFNQILKRELGLEP